MKSNKTIHELVMDYRVMSNGEMKNVEIDTLENTCIVKSV